MKTFIRQLIAVFALASVFGNYSLAANNTALRMVTAVSSPALSTDTNYGAFQTLLGYKSPLLTAQEPFVNLGTQGTCSASLALDCETTTGPCVPNISFTVLDALITAYPTASIVQPQAEGNASSVPPPCVYGQGQANAAALAWSANTKYMAGWYICVNSSGVGVGGACGGNYWQIQAGGYSGSGFDNTVTTGAGGAALTSCWLAASGNCTDGTATWVLSSYASGTDAPPQDGSCTSSHQCITGGNNCYTTNGSVGIVLNMYTVGVGNSCTNAEFMVSQLVFYELPYMNWVNQVIAAFVAHYNTANATIKANLRYVRFGAAGGENAFSTDMSIWPFIGGSAFQIRAQLLTWVNYYYTDIMANGPTFPIVANGNCVGSPEDCSYADQEAFIAFSVGMNGIGNSDAAISDVDNLLGNGQGTGNCTFPLMPINPADPAVPCTEGDWGYIFFAYPTMLHYLQGLASGSTPLDCRSAAPGPLGALPSGMTYCPSGNPGLLNAFATINSAGVDGGTVFLNINIWESHTEPSGGSFPDVTANDTFMALYPGYTSTSGAQTAYQPYQATYQAAYANFLGVIPAPSALW